MTQDELILQLLRAVAEAMVCEKCDGTGYVTTINRNASWGDGPNVKTVPCTCRVAVRTLLVKDRV